MSADRSEVKRIAAEKLGGWRFGVRGEIRGLIRLLGPGERIASMGVGTSGLLHGRLIVATDRRLLLIHKLPLLPLRYEEFGFEELESARVIEDDPWPKLVVVASGRELSFLVSPGDRATELAEQMGEPLGAQEVSIQPTGAKREERISPSWWLLGLSGLIIIAWITGAVPWVVGLVAYAVVSLGDVLWYVIKGDNRAARISAIGSLAIGALLALTISH